jgi:hypothetical protein
MFSSLALVTLMSISPGQMNPTLTLSNVRATYGELGSPRPDMKVIPGDILIINFDIEGIQTNKEGNVRYSMEMEVLDSKGKAIFKPRPLEKNDYLPFGGNILPARAYVRVEVDQPAGTCTCKVTVKDLSTKAVGSFEKKFDVLKTEFGFVRVYTSSDDLGKISSPQIGVVGQSVWLNLAVVGFDRNSSNKQPNVEVEMNVLDKNGKPTIETPMKFVGDRNIPEEDFGFPLQFMLPMNRAGDYTIELKATDKVNKKTSKVALPFKVFAPGK